MAKRVVIGGLTIALAWLCAVAPAAADPPRFGIKAGWLSSDLRGDPPSGPFLATDFSSTSGVTAGAFTRFGLASKLDLQIEVLYARRGAEGSANVTVQPVPLGPGGNQGFGQGPGPSVGTRAVLSVQPKVDLLEIPALLRYTLGNGGTRPVLFAGPSVAFKLAASSEVAAPAGWRPGDIGLVTDISDDVNALNFGLVFGLGADIDLGSSQIVLDARYNLGLTDVFDTGARFPGYRPCCEPDGVLGRIERGSLKWSGFALSAGYVF